MCGRRFLRIWWKAIAHGFPTPSMACQYELPPTRMPPYRAVGGIDTGLDWMERGLAFQPRALPLVPIWPMVFYNSLFWAFVTWVMFVVSVRYRLRRRIKRGLCPACAYPIGGSPVCTECGKPLPQRAESAA